MNKTILVLMIIGLTLEILSLAFGQALFWIGLATWVVCAPFLFFTR